MDELPSESENRENVLARFAEDFRYASELLETSVKTAEVYCSSEKSGFDLDVTMLIGGILAREIRRFRSIVLVAQSGFLENAEVLSRSLFEGLLGERFILKTPIALNECSPALRKRRQGLPDYPTGTPCATFHAHLYVAYRSLILKRLKDDEDDEQGEATERILKEDESSIGAEWLKTIKRYRTYSGLTIAQLAENYGLTALHKDLYAVHSQTSHANDALSFIEFDCSYESPSISLMLVTSEAYLRQLPYILRLATGTLGTLLDDIIGSFRLESVQDALADFFARYKAFTEQA